VPSSTLFIAVLDLVGEYVPWVVLAVARPFGFTLLFAMFAWGHVSNGIIRMAFALAIAMPLLANGIPAYGMEGLQLSFIGTLLKEIFLGAMLGFLCSVPLAIAVAGGGIIDFYRGTFIGDPDPSGGEATTHATLFAVIILWLFANVGGFQIVTDAIYTSYDVWSVKSGFPTFSPGADLLLQLLEKILLGALVLAGPITALMFLSDIIHLISTKFGKQIDVTQLLFSNKNIIALLALPLFVVVVIRFLRGELEFLATVSSLMSAILR